MENNGQRNVPSAVPIHHRGPIPGVPVGSSWKYRWQVSKDGVHRPIVAGIHGGAKEGVFSVVLSGVYPLDKDRGEYFVYSGCGGRARDKNKNITPQVYDQQLTGKNRGLALCCNAEINDNDEGSDAKECWRFGRPVRVVRKHSRISIYSPEEGFRYDGIYKIVKYRRVRDPTTGLKVWTFEFRRDDEDPAPWTQEGIEYIKSMNLRMKEPLKYTCTLLSDTKIVLKKITSTDQEEVQHFDQTATTSGTNIPSTSTAPPQDSSSDVKPTLEELQRALARSATVIDADIKPEVD